MRNAEYVEHLLTDFGFEYVKALAHTFYGIAEVYLVKAEGLDIWGADPIRILEQAKCEIPAILANHQNV